MKRQKQKILYRNMFTYYIREESSVHKYFVKYKGGVLSYEEFFDIVEELNNIVYCNYYDKPFLAEVGGTDFIKRYRDYL